MLTVVAQEAKPQRNLSTERQTAFKRAQTLNNGISVSWLEQTWDNNLADSEGIKDSDFELLKTLGFKSIRLPVAFKYLENKQGPNEKVLARVENFWQKCRKYGFKLVIDYHYGELTNENHYNETAAIVKTWTAVAERFKSASPDQLFFEIYNEPGPIDPQVWKDAAYNIVTALRKIDPKRTLLVGASNYNSIYELSRFVRLKDDNIIYVFHFYEPFLFTHQGADWVGVQMATTGIGFPYANSTFPPMNEKAKGSFGESNYKKYHLDGNEGSITDKLKIVKAWADKYSVPIICGEYGVYNKYTDPQSRVNYIKAVRTSLKQLNIPGILWEYNCNFSIFDGEPSLDNLSTGMKEAIGYHDQK
ncbi:glycoside hydrolase family 5 protein [Mucilaginibacter myungsuensis]|uniref:Cellulase family glycosylhydrolase n=1 Tax=Mucilaginibacter myungsuensis TaxID=649104 RepID=A0A929PVF8_9SPHI|nr:cellulase family glycosylhydrolase [Mucilaginibacter myungsuensis]MBE9660966.1 cellulase family glycosylhydrolase [Mucilaginibacter myungsuensis]MDN3601012.1 cellulase family glycosylhydrolase [Mucilaginibacter myungsuensis]